ncbi:MAG: hypothetical protein J7J78_03990 [Thermoprotei archaeon]|nr:hypothetical protein [Thermoprotei archaeon]
MTFLALFSEVWLWWVTRFIARNAVGAAGAGLFMTIAYLCLATLAYVALAYIVSLAIGRELNILVEVVS